MHPAIVRWSTRARVYAALFGAGSIPLTLWAFEKDGVGMGMILGAGIFVVSAGALVHFSVFRIETTDEGLDIHELFSSRRVAWKEIVRVELIAQWRSAEGIVRMATNNPSDAYHVVLVCRDRRINLNRHMDGIDELIAALQNHGALKLDDKIMREAARRAAHPVSRGLEAVADGAIFIKVAFGAFFATFVVALFAASSRAFRFTGQFFVDMVLVSALLLGLFWGIVWLAKRIRLSRFGDAPKEPPTTAKDLLMTYVAALAGPLLAAGYLPRALAPDAKDRWVEVILLLVGVWFTTIPIKEFYQYAFRR